MTRYHVNPTTGNTGPCEAKEGNCPLGSPEENPHFSSVEDARSHAETLMNEKYEWRAVRTVRDQEGKLIVSGGPTGNERTIQEAKTLMEELKKTDSTYPTDGEKSYALVRRQRHWETVEQEREDPN